MRFVFRKPDLDTVTAAVLLGYRPGMELRCVNSNATFEEFLDPKVVCLECGGAGQQSLNNYDHHDPNVNLPPACVQALNRYQGANAAINNIIRYVAAVDTGQNICRHGSFGITLSHAFSGMRLAIEDCKEQFNSGAELVSKVIESNASPWDIPKNLVSRRWIEAKRYSRNHMLSICQNTKKFMTNKGWKAMLLRAPVPGVHGYLRKLGAHVSVACGLAKGNQYSISGQSSLLSGLSDNLNIIETGWGGPSHGGILCSPYSGTRLTESDIVRCITLFC